MSKTQTVRTEITFEDAPVLAELDFPALVKSYRKIHLKEKEAELEAARFKAQKTPIGEEIQEALKVAGADTVTMEISGKEFRTSLVKGDENATKTNEDKLRENMMKMGKLDAVLVAKIFEKSQVPAVRKSHILITVKE